MNMCDDCALHTAPDPDDGYLCPIADAIDQVELPEGTEIHWNAVECPYYVGLGEKLRDDGNGGNGRTADGDGNDERRDEQ